MRRTDTAYLQHVLDANLKVESYLLGLDESAFLADTRTQDAVVRQIEIIGEASKKVSSETRGRNPDTPWQDIAGMRDKLIHDYFSVDLRRVWNTAKRDLPPLKATVFRLLKGEQGSSRPPALSPTCTTGRSNSTWMLDLRYGLAQSLTRVALCRRVAQLDAIRRP